MTTFYAVQEKIAKDCTFAPKINRSKWLDRHQVNRDDEAMMMTTTVDDGTGEMVQVKVAMTIYDKLAMDTKAAIADKRERERVTRELEGCSFHPLINHWVTPHHDINIVEDRLLEEVLPCVV